MQMNTNNETHATHAKPTRYRIARSNTTGLYFNGTTFEAVSPLDAKHLPERITAEDMQLVWGKNITMELVPLSLAQKVHYGLLTKFGAAREYVLNQVKLHGSSRCTVRTLSGKYISRKIYWNRTERDSVWIRYQGTQIALEWSMGELAVDSGFVG